MTRPAAQETTELTENIMDAEEDPAQGEIASRAPLGLQDRATVATAGMWMTFSGASEISRES